MSIRTGVAGLAVLAVTGLGWQAWAGDGEAVGNYRWATAEVGTVTTTTALSGTVQPAGRAELQFGTSGTVATVNVAEGDTVAKGEVLVTLDTAALKRKVRAATSELKIARATLAAHEDGQQALVSSAASAGSAGSSGGSAGVARSSTTTAATGTGAVDTVAAVHRTTTTSATATTGTAAVVTTSTAATGVRTVASSSDVTSALSLVTAQQSAVKAAQSTVSNAKQAAQTALTAQQTACGAAYANNADDDAALNQACDDALAAVQQAQAEVSTAQDALSTALDALAGTLTSAATTLQSATDDLARAEQDATTQGGGSSSGGTGAGTSQGEQADPQKSGQNGQQKGGSAGSAPSGSAPSGSAPSASSKSEQPQGAPSGGTGAGSTSGSTTITAAQLASDQADVDQATADLAAAQQNLAGARVKAPWAGTMASVTVAPGDAASSGGTAVVLVAPGTTTVQVSASAAQVKKLREGQQATVTPAGASAPVPATVSSVSTDSADGSSFAVVLTLDESSAAASGTPASVSVVTGTAEDAVTVPSSALTNGSVTVRSGEEIETRKVSVGLVGTTLTQVTDGLEAGDEVALADLSAEVSGAGEITTTNGFGGRGGPGVDTGPGGFPGGAGRRG